MAKSPVKSALNSSRSLPETHHPQNSGMSSQGLGVNHSIHGQVISNHQRQFSIPHQRPNATGQHYSQNLLSEPHLRTAMQNDGLAAMNGYRDSSPRYVNDRTVGMAQSTYNRPYGNAIDRKQIPGVETSPEHDGKREIYHNENQTENSSTIDPYLKSSSNFVAKGVPPLEPSQARNWTRSRELMMTIFLESDSNSISEVLRHDDPALDIDCPIDEFNHTALHWAATLGRIPTVEALINRGANPLRTNAAGESALIRAVQVTNNLDQSSFTKLLSLLHSNITLVDYQGRTVLHHITLTAGIKGRSAASRYYLECLLEWIVKQSSSNSQEEGLNLQSFLSSTLDAQDYNGDTALNIAARVGNKSLVQQLLDVGSNPGIPNKAGLRPLDFDIGVLQSSYPSNVPIKPLMSSRVTEKSKDIVEGKRQKSKIQYYFSWYSNFSYK